MDALKYTIKAPKKQEKEREHLVPFVSPVLSKGLRERAEIKSVMEMIDRELKQPESVPELDFTAGYIAGRIKEKDAAGSITDTQAGQLIKVLYSKYELLRNLKKCAEG